MRTRCAGPRGESIDALRPWMDWAQRAPTPAESLAQARRSREEFERDEEYQLLMFRGDRIVGSTGFHQVDWRVPKLEIGYWVRTSDSGRGYVTEAVAALTALAFERLGAARLEIRCHPENEASRRIPERLGFTLEGILRRDSVHVDGSLRDTALYARLRSSAE